MLKDLNFGLKQRFNIKCSIDLVVFIANFTLFAVYVIKHSNNPYEALLYMAIVIILFVSSHFITKQWLLGIISKSLTAQSESVSEVTTEAIETINNQKRVLESFTTNSKNLSNLIEKLKVLSGEAIATSKNTEKQVNQSITFSQKEYESITSNSEKMLILRQKVQMIAELILELSEHTQQIGNTISVVDDIGEQTNMLALNAAVEAARAGEHGKGFAVVAGEIRKLADESKQAITKITSLTSNIQYTTNSTVMATEEGSKEIENVVKDINTISSNSELLLNLIKSVLESLDALNTNALKQSDIIEKLNNLDEENKNVSENLAQLMSTNFDKLNKLSNLSNEIKNSAIEG